MLPSRTTRCDAGIWDGSAGCPADVPVPGVSGAADVDASRLSRHVVATSATGVGGAFSSEATDIGGEAPRSTPRQRGQRSGGWSVAGSVATSEPQCLQLMNMRLLNHAAALPVAARQACLRTPSIRTQSPSRVTASCSNHGR